MISSFLDIIVRHGRPGRGLFGKCSGYYGTVEAQGRGTLHCHFLIWIDGHPNPQRMRDLMQESQENQQQMFEWLESLIKCELLGTSEVVAEPGGKPLKRPRIPEREGFVHPGLQPGPRVMDCTPEQFSNAYDLYVNQLVEQYNWHEHTFACWKYLKRTDSRDDQACRMRIDGSTRPATVVDEETGSILLRRLHPRIANYNDLVMFLMKCNMDIKHIGSGEGAKTLIYYVTDYITKSSLPAHLGLAALLYAINRTDRRCAGSSEWTDSHDSAALTTVVNSMLARQEISHAQVMSYLVGGGDHYMSHQFRVLHLAHFERYLARKNQSSRCQTSTEECSRNDSATPHNTQSTQHNSERMDIEEENVTLTLGTGSIAALNQVQDYLYRPQSTPFDGMTLYEFVGLTEKLTKRCENARLHR
ncbi:hypothetical protein C8Q76DRAFT_630109, partial [Earliella scabrosa]